MKYLIPLIALSLIPLAGAFQVTSPSQPRRNLKSTHVVHAATIDENNQFDPIWLTPDDMKALSEASKITTETLSAVHSDATYYRKSPEPEMYRINRRRGDEALLKSIAGIESTAAPPPVAQDAAEKTLRWCEGFVQKLNLCPWAKLSLQSSNAIRIKIMHQSMGTEGMEQLIRDSAHELIDLMESGEVDINVGITFVIAIGNDDSDAGEPAFDFEDFYAFVIDLEDRMFDEADAAADEKMDDSEVEDVYMPMDPFGDKVTIAPFHPEWFFAVEGEGDENPLNYEKKSPFPTVSLVRTSTIIQAGEEATRRIGEHNEEILTEYGSQKLSTLYRENVLRNSD